jgi:hypothetical protein
MWWESDSGLLYIYYVDPSGPPGQWVIAAPQPDLSTFIIKSGDTMTGPLVLPGNPTLNLQAATKQYVDGLLASPTLTGDPKAPTPSPLDNDTSIATTAFVTAALSVTTNISWIDLADAATIIVPGGVSGGFGRNFRLNPMAGNRTLGYLQTAVPGSTGIIAIKQDSVGSRTLSGLTSNGYFCDGDTAFAIGITANKWSLISYQVIDATHTFLQLVAVNVSLG